MNGAAVAGVAMTPVTRDLPGTIRDVASRVAHAAAADAGIALGEIDGFFVTPLGLGGEPSFMASCWLAHHLGLSTKAQALVECGGMTATQALRYAQLEVACGRCRAALVVALDRRTTDIPEDFEHFIKNAAVQQINLYGPCDGAYGLGAPIPYYAMSAQRYLAATGATERDLAEVVCRLRANAVLNPYARFQKAVTVDEVLASRPISPPLKLLDCSQFASGAAAAVLVPDEGSRTPAGRPLVRIRAWGEYHTPSHFSSYARLTAGAAWKEPDLAAFESVERAGREAYEAAGFGPEAIDVAEVYGVFSATELILYEGLGFARPGEAPALVRSGRTAPDGGGPALNPSGGRIAVGHPAAATPLIELCEVTWQLRGEAEGRQRADARRGLIHAEHGMLNGSAVAILER